MIRLVSVALLVTVVGSPGWSQSGRSAPKPTDAWRVSETAASPSPFTLPDGRDLPLESGQAQIFAGTEISPNATLGFGLFGAKRDRTAPRPVTVYEVNTRQTRKAGIRFTLKF